MALWPGERLLCFFVKGSGELRLCQGSLWTAWRGQTSTQVPQLMPVSYTHLDGYKRQLRWDDRVGSIEPGKLADVIAFDSSPLEDIRVMTNCTFVMKDGVVYKG